MAAEPKSNMALVCKPCHKIKSYAEKEGLSFQEAKVMKLVIAEENRLKTRAGTWLISKGFSKDEVSNKPKRRKCFKRLIEDELNK